MACHICDNNAVGLCRQCFKFYCQEHGDGFLNGPWIITCALPPASEWISPQ
jgi:hypothetical protein